ncbi:MAG: ribosome recycling factor [Candidatus Doudnabacteria bacterium RIFCSPHIGHO2_02_FULL_46_11]|uniref:Ribosome-recycling factor n=1 Tax=Candidatus Doudnabacteria bacterium RIFCSPHIGHO2_02_FULL_46_11 TaxID=1817832 RepID=A0A1F5P544_9BACT|nr:MAG: ribosome recycling factor [Candidatus Doudnabacteria bacterium RIFCSPHIGHO2_02_FULL_46_11]
MATVQEVISSKHEDFTKSVEHFKGELSVLRTGRASTGLVDLIPIEAYGAVQPLRDLAQITVPESRQILVQPWDKSILANIEKSIQTSSLGVNPVNDGNAIRISLPALTEERRKELAKVVGQHAEAARVSVRSVRESAMKELKRLDETDEISEDERFRGEEQLQKKVDELNKQIKEIAEAKEKEIMTV